MKRLLLLLLLAGPAWAQLVQAPPGMKSATGTASVVLTEHAGSTSLVGVSFCENGCAVSPASDSLTVKDSQGNACFSVTAQIKANQLGAIWQCPAQAGPNTVTATATLGPSEPVGAFIHTALSVSEWVTLPRYFALSVGSNSMSGMNCTLVNSYNGSFATEQCASFPTFSPAPANLVSASFGLPPKLINLTVATQLLQCTVCDGTDDTPIQGSVSVVQQGTAVTAPLNSDGTVTLSFGINIAVDPADFTFTLLDTTDKPVGNGLEWKLPQSILQSSAGFILGILSVPPMRFTITNGQWKFSGFKGP